MRNAISDHSNPHEMAGHMRDYGEKGAVGHGCYLGDVAVMVADETQVADECAEITPTGERFCLDQETAEITRLFDIRIEFPRLPPIQSLSFRSTVRCRAIDAR